MLSKARTEIARRLLGQQHGVSGAAGTAVAEEAFRALETALSDLENDLSEAQARLQAVTRERDEARKSALERAEVVDRLEFEKKQVKQEMHSALREKRRSEEHPIYGRLLHDFGYKKVFASEPLKVTNKALLPVYEKQRSFRPDRARQIAKDKKKDNRFGFPGIITIYDEEAPDKRGVVDGQHRLGSLEILIRDGTWNDNDLILTEVYPVGDSKEHVQDLFIEINQSQPVQEVDMPGSAEDSVRDTITLAAEALAAEFGEMFKTSARCRPPHLNVDNLRQDLFESEKVREFIQAELEAAGPSVTNVHTILLEWLKAENDTLASRTESDWQGSALVRVKNPKTLSKALEKATKHHFFLGLDFSWL